VWQADEYAHQHWKLVFEAEEDAPRCGRLARRARQVRTDELGEVIGLGTSPSFVLRSFLILVRKLPPAAGAAFTLLVSDMTGVNVCARACVSNAFAC
jgi:hypothetical protein